MTGVFIKEKRGRVSHTHTHVEAGHVKPEAEIGVMQL